MPDAIPSPSEDRQLVILEIEVSNALLNVLNASSVCFLFQLHLPLFHHDVASLCLGQAFLHMFPFVVRKYFANIDFVFNQN